MAAPSYYDILGIQKDANESDIKKAYRSLSLKYHPDRNQTEEAKVKIQQINEAYETLGDPAMRKGYDQKQEGGGGSPFGNMGMPGEFNDILNMMFGGMPGGMPSGMPGGPNVRFFHNGMPAQFRQQRPPPIVSKIELTMEQSYSGCVHPITIERTIKNEDTSETETETIYINIPHGINHGETVVLHDKGNIVNSICGYVNITVMINNTTDFQRHGLDLVYNKKISLKEALCGFTFELNHPNGKKFAINNNDKPSIIKPNYKKNVPGYGMKRDNNIGSLIVVFDIVFPDTLTDEQMRLISEGLA